MKYSIGFIGCGNMAKAIIAGLLEKKIYLKEQMIASTQTLESAQKVSQNYGIETTCNNLEILEKSEIIVLAVKPQILTSLVTTFSDYDLENKIVISIAAGVTLETLAKHLKTKELYRVMPNTPSCVGEGMSSLCYLETNPLNWLERVKTLFEAIGRCAVIPEKLMHAAIASHGSSPAYFYMMLEAMGDAGVKLGLSRPLAYEMAAQAMLGAAKTYLETKIHPGALKDQVTSPGGTTIEAVASLEKNGFRNAIIEAMIDCAQKSQNL